MSGRRHCHQPSQGSAQASDLSRALKPANLTLHSCPGSGLEGPAARASGLRAGSCTSGVRNKRASLDAELPRGAGLPNIGCLVMFGFGFSLKAAAWAPPGGATGMVRPKPSRQGRLASARLRAGPRLWKGYL